MKFHHKALAAALFFLIFSGCVNDSAKLHLSPCAGCNFRPVNVELVRPQEPNLKQT